MKALSSSRKSFGDRRLVCAFVLGLFGLAGATAAPNAQERESNAREEPSSARVGLFSEPRFIGRGIDFGTRTIGDGSGMKNGFYLELSNMVTGAGWISGGPGYRYWLFDDRAVVETSAAYSWRGYKMAQARFEFTRLAKSRVAVGSQARWQDYMQVSYFGDGPDTLESSRSEYRMRSTNVVGYGTVRPAQWLAVTGRIGWLGRPSLLEPGGRFMRGNPSVREAFPDNIVFTLAEQPRYIHGEASVVADTRDYRSYPSEGGVYRAAWTRYADRDAGTFSFDRYEAEAAHFVPVVDRRLVLAFHGWLVGSQTADGHAVPFYLEPGLGGNNTLRSVTDYRFHDRNMVVATAEARLALFTHVDGVLFVDAGNVGPRVADLDFAKRAYGIGMRVHSNRATFGRVDVAHGVEGWNFLFRLNDPLHLSRLSKRTAAAPFAP